VRESVLSQEIEQQNLANTKCGELLMTAYSYFENRIFSFLVSLVVICWFLESAQEKKIRHDHRNEE
jgi:hypothetical protein